MTAPRLATDLSADQKLALDAYHGARLQQFAQAYRVTASLLAARPLDRDLFGKLAAARERTFDMIDADAAEEVRRQGRAVACKMGCAMCCYQNVAITATEAIRIAQYILDNDVDPARIAPSAALVSTLDPHRRYREGHACPLLKDEVCSIYPVRPQACRGHASLSRYACERDWKRRFKPQRDHMKNVPLLTAPHTLGRAVVMGSDAAVMDRGFQVARFELAQGLTQALAAGAITRWFAKEQVFAADNEYGATLRSYKAQTGLS